MKKSTGAASTVYPEPVFMVATYNDDGTPNAMAAAWGGIANDKLISICIDKGHRTAENVVKRGAFTVSMADEANIVACDYLGIVSGNDVPDKFARSGLHATRSDLVDAPVIDELCMCLECEVVDYVDETLTGIIVDIKADESVLTDGKIDVEKLKPVVYDPVAHTYRSIGGVVGRAFGDGKKLM
ncbi:MAG: flavin reductase family protein [Candidatus Methanomethylophilaceae archaeon]|nr:flavin reductase family protein [Candidatus Methanomethylophilaceae archaeon]